MEDPERTADWMQTVRINDKELSFIRMDSSLSGCTVFRYSGTFWARGWRTELKQMKSSHPSPVHSKKPSTHRQGQWMKCDQMWPTEQNPKTVYCDMKQKMRPESTSVSMLANAAEAHGNVSSSAGVRSEHVNMQTLMRPCVQLLNMFERTWLWGVWLQLRGRRRHSSPLDFVEVDIFAAVLLCEVIRLMDSRDYKYLLKV